MGVQETRAGGALSAGIEEEGAGVAAAAAVAAVFLNVGLDCGAGEAGLSHHAADAGVVEDRDDELLQLHSDG